MQPPLDKNASLLLEPGEQVLTEVRRHPIGVIMIFLGALIGLGALAGIVAAVYPSIGKNLSHQMRSLIILGIVVVLAVLAAILVVAVYIYRQSRLLITDHSLVEVLQKSLFSKKVSRLSMSNVQDVDVDQKGILQTIFKFGTLTIQTAGEEDNFIFPWCPSPNAYAERILQARQAYARGIHNVSAASSTDQPSTV